MVEVGEAGGGEEGVGRRAGANGVAELAEGNVGAGERKRKRKRGRAWMMLCTDLL